MGIEIKKRKKCAKFIRSVIGIKDRNCEIGENGKDIYEKKNKEENKKDEG